MLTPDAIQALLDATPISSTLGAKLERMDTDNHELHLHYQVGESFTNPAGQVQGGIVSAMLDDVTSILASLCAPDYYCSTLSLTTNYLSSARPGVLTASASFEKQGKSVVNLRGTLYQNGRAIATATAVSLLRAKNA